ncbi:hypothetical protein BGZ95_009688 [Linnemannia exigua]|uniref:F-box domain-containing protein n=1 Tax=Linnemannia exigua TaxID=604196 RepID=A0AAD4DCG6_9FUNG|nr:hypothetical protein BGZ95_009688 [Linnemannia exigua]
MQLVPENRPSNLLDLPEIRVLVARYLARSDCRSCMRVCHDWFRDFAPALWHTIDFSKDATAFSSVSSDVLDKYAGFISQVINMSEVSHIKSLQHYKVDSIQTMKINLPNNWFYREMLSDLYLRCRGSIEDLDISTNPSDPNTLENQRKWASRRADLAPSHANNTELMSDLLFHSFTSLKSCTLYAQNFAMSTAFGLVIHQETLVSLTIKGEMKDNSSVKFLPLVVRLSRHLQFLSLESFVCDLEKVGRNLSESFGLQELRIRFKSLDAPQDIDRCIQQVCDWRRSGNIPSIPPQHDDSISTSCARVLILLKQLRTVWLGTKVYYLPPSPMTQ